MQILEHEVRVEAYKEKMKATRRQALEEEKKAPQTQQQAAT